MKRNLPVWVLTLVLAGGIVWAGYLARGHMSGTASVVDRFETVLLDLRVAMAGHRVPPPEVIIVAIDDNTVALTGQYPLTRSGLAALIDRIKESGARALAVDILLFGSSGRQEDRILAKSIASMPTVIAGAGHIGERLPTASFVPAINTVLSPAPAIAGSAAVGLANMVTDTGGSLRHIPMLFLTAEGLQPSFSLQALGLYLDETPSFIESGLRLDGRTVPLDIGWHLALNYYGPGGTIPTVSARQLFEDEPAARAQLSDRLVVLGVTATAVGDRFNTPFDPVLPGVEVQATGIANLIDGSSLVRSTGTRGLDGAAALAITVLGVLAVAFLPLAQASVIYILLLLGWLATITFAFFQGHWLNGALPFAASLPPVIAILIVRQVADRYQSRFLLRAQQALSRFQSPKLAERIANDPSFLSVPKEQQAAILFIDLSGYTGLSEHLGPVKTRNFLKDFHTVVVDIVSQEDGVVLDFMGDGAMLGFGIPEECPLDPVRALRCAFHLQRKISDWLASTEQKVEIGEVRVGAHLGPVVLSRLGHDSQQQIAATGDCVNVASRLLEVGKDRNASIVVSSGLINAVRDVAECNVSVPRLETVSIRGRRKALEVGLWTAEEAMAIPQCASVAAADQSAAG
ncbi:CHASE2 domain-containing protein [Hoeflea sp.]|uniref:CHASE2 domain-containing protein n=1 Tax=Hoeflea sp. TaxID=1940281 RepID=UPI003B02C422